MKIYNPDYAVDLLQALIWQYDNAPRLQKLIQQKQDWYNRNNTEFWTDWLKNVFNINTANDFGLTVWGIPSTENPIRLIRNNTVCC